MQQPQPSSLNASSVVATQLCINPPPPSPARRGFSNPRRHSGCHVLGWEGGGHSSAPLAGWVPRTLPDQLNILLPLHCWIRHLSPAKPGEHCRQCCSHRWWGPVESPSLLSLLLTFRMREAMRIGAREKKRACSWGWHGCAGLQWDSETCKYNSLWW